MVSVSLKFVNQDSFNDYRSQFFEMIRERYVATGKRSKQEGNGPIDLHQKKGS